MGVRVTAGIHETEPTDLQSRRSPGVRQIHLRDHSGDALFRHFKELASAQNRRYNARNWSLELTNKMLKIHVFFSVPPRTSPTISGVKEYYSDGDIVEVTCRSRNSKPAAKLTWFMNDHPVMRVSKVRAGPFSRFGKWIFSFSRFRRCF